MTEQSTKSEVGADYALMIRRGVFERFKNRLIANGCGQTNECLRDHLYVWITFPAGSSVEEVEEVEDAVRFTLPNETSFCVNIHDAYARRAIFAWEDSTSGEE